MTSSIFSSSGKLMALPQCWWCKSGIDDRSPTPSKQCAEYRPQSAQKSAPCCCKPSHFTDQIFCHLSP